MELGTPFCKRAIRLSKAELNMLMHPKHNYLQLIRRRTKTRYKYIKRNKFCQVIIRGNQMDVDAAHHDLMIVLKKTPKEHPDLQPLVLDIEEVNTRRRRRRRREREIMMPEHMEEFHKCNEMLEQPENTRVQAQEPRIPKKCVKDSENNFKPMLAALLSPGPLEDVLWASFQIPFTVPLPRNKAKAMNAIAAVTITGPALNITTLKFLICKKILEYLEAKDKSTHQYHFLNYFQLLSKIVFRYMSKESFNTFRELKNSLLDLKKFQENNLPPEMYTHLAGLYSQIVDPPRRDLPKMLNAVRKWTNRMEKCNIVSACQQSLLKI